MLGGAAFIFVLVMSSLALAFRRRDSAEADDRGRESVWIAGMGLGFPFAVLAALLAYGLHVGEQLLPRPGDDVTHVGAEARRSSWSFDYAMRPGIQTEGVLHIPAGRPVDVAITSVDVIHSFWVPRLAGKLDAIPGRVNVLRIEADAPGQYHGLSAEFSGTGYDHFSFSIMAHDAAGWTQFLRGELP